LEKAMASERSAPWYKEWYVYVSLLVAILGLGVVCRDYHVRNMKNILFQVKLEADQLCLSGKYEQAVQRYDSMLAHVTGWTDPEVQSAGEDARRRREQASELFSQARARLLDEQAKQREREEATRQAAEQVAAYERVEQSPDYQALLRRAQEHETDSPGVASRYYQDIVDQFPETVQAKVARAKSRELSAIAYGNQTESRSTEGTVSSSLVSTTGSSGGDLCGAPLGNGLICRNRVKSGDISCYLHSATTASNSGTYVGPRGGVYHYSKSGKKVYERRR
jgi:hypothetical protein